jgi:hypothetical protein
MEVMVAGIHLKAVAASIQLEAVAASIRNEKQLISSHTFHAGCLLPQHAQH